MEPTLARALLMEILELNLKEGENESRLAALVIIFVAMIAYIIVHCDIMDEL